MRTLNRPMFNMGGPIKQGVMNGIREPYRGGGKAALVGNPVYPKTDGREHHFAVSGTIAAGVGLNALRHGAMRYGARLLPKLKNIFGSTTPAKFVPKSGVRIPSSGTYSGVESIPAKFNPNWLGRDPVVQSLGWAGKTLTGPTSKSLAGKALQFAISPSTVIGGVAWYMWPDGTERKTPPPQTGGVPGGGDPGMTYTKPGPKKLSESERKAFANKQREERVQKYMDMMGYDRAKKTAIADALIDASKIVGDRGTLDLKNITQELINPVIQATSKRLDKPDQIREAVGLMATKAEIEKDLSKETDALAKEKTVKQIEVLDRQLEQGFESDIRNLLLTARTPPNKAQLEQYARLTADKYGETFTKVEGEGDISGDGIYMVEGTLVRVKDGKPKRIV